jgi:short subunit dehydrogenase-like uncharacterized protein
MMSVSRRFDLVLYGATGFVGQQAVAYLARACARQGFRWAVAGRSEAKLRILLRRLGLEDVPIIVADARDSVALQVLAEQTSVVASAAGPYALYGSELGAACVKSGAHYVDITGETPWVRQMIDLHHATARRARLKIIPGCGFDSIPSDLGVALMAEAMRAAGQCLASAKSAYRIGGGGLNGGTAGSLINVLEAGQGHLVEDLFLLNPEGTRPESLLGHEDPFAPSLDPDFGAWVGPFFMGPINSRVVRRSAALRGETICYQEFMRFGRGTKAAALATVFSSGSIAGQALLKWPPARRMAQRFMPQAGEGPSEAAMNKGFFVCDLVGESGRGQRMRAKVADQGDAGNRATTKMMCESALALVYDFAQLPKTYGVITPSFALGGGYDGVLATRLRQAGMRIELHHA